MPRVEGIAISSLKCADVRGTEKCSLFIGKLCDYDPNFRQGTFGNVAERVRSATTARDVSRRSATIDRGSPNHRDLFKRRIGSATCARTLCEDPSNTREYFLLYHFTILV